MGYSIEVDQLRLSAAVKSLTDLPDRAANWGEALRRDVGLVIQSEVDEQFNKAPRGASGGSTYFGVTWDKLSDAYLKQRPDRAQGQILRDTGELLQSLQVGGAGNVLTGDRNSVIFGTNLPKARGLQKKRQFLIITDRMAELVATVIEKHIAGL